MKWAQARGPNTCPNDIGGYVPRDNFENSNEERKRPNDAVVAAAAAAEARAAALAARGGRRLPLGTDLTCPYETGYFKLSARRTAVWNSMRSNGSATLWQRALADRLIGYDFARALRVDTPRVLWCDANEATSHFLLTPSADSPHTLY